MIMETNNVISRSLYEVPVIEFLDCVSEGVLCQSVPAQGETWNDGGDI